MCESVYRLNCYLTLKWAALPRTKLERSILGYEKTFSNTKSFLYTIIVCPTTRAPYSNCISIYGTTTPSLKRSPSQYNWVWSTGKRFYYFQHGQHLGTWTGWIYLIDFSWSLINFPYTGISIVILIIFEQRVVFLNAYRSFFSFHVFSEFSFWWSSLSITMYHWQR